MNAPRYLIALLLAGVTSLSAQTETRATIAGRSVLIWQPAAGSEGKRPLVVFSHGYGGCAGQSKFLTKALAGHGYWVVAPNHRDARCGFGRPGRPEDPFRRPASWSEASYVDRAEDVRAIVRALGDSAQLKSRLDVSRIAVAGHSLGGYTSLGLGGGWGSASWSLPGVKAILALSPYSDPFLVSKRLSRLTAPVMYQTGTRDFGINRSLKKSNGVYDQSPAPKYYVDFEGAAHTAWSVRDTTYHKQIVRYAIAFLDHYVLGAAAAPELSQKLSQVADLRFQQ